MANDYLELHEVTGGRHFSVDRDWLGPVPYPVAGPSIQDLRRLPASTNPHLTCAKTGTPNSAGNRSKVQRDIATRRDHDDVALQVGLELGDAIQAPKAVFDGLDSR